MRTHPLLADQHTKTEEKKKKAQIDRRSIFFPFFFFLQSAHYHDGQTDKTNVSTIMRQARKVIDMVRKGVQASKLRDLVEVDSAAARYDFRVEVIIFFCGTYTAVVIVGMRMRVMEGRGRSEE